MKDKREPMEKDGQYIVTARCPKCGWIRRIIVSFAELWNMRYDRRPQVWCDECVRKLGGSIAQDLLEKRPEQLG